MHSLYQIVTSGISRNILTNLNYGHHILYRGIYVGTIINNKVFGDTGNSSEMVR